MGKEIFGAIFPEELMVVRYGNRPTTTGAGVKTFTANAHAYTAREATVITHFIDENDDEIVIGWEGKTIASGQTVWFGLLIKKIEVLTGGLGEYYLSESDL